MRRVKLSVARPVRKGNVYNMVLLDGNNAVIPEENAPPYLDFDEVTAPDAPATNVARLFVRDNGAGKTQVCVRFPTGAIQVVTTEP